MRVLTVYRYTRDQDDFKWFHHKRLLGKMDADHQVSGFDSLSILGFVSWQRRTHGSYCQLFG